MAPPASPAPLPEHVSAAPPVPPAAAPRRPTGPGWTIIRTAGSLRIAMVLFIAIIVGSLVGTIAESRFDARVARYYVYDAPWFTFWLVALIINLAAAALSRWPWQKRHTGFIIVHSGIILLLIGAMIGRRWGVEGSVTLRVGEAPRAWMLVQEMALTFTDPLTGEAYRTPLPVDLRPPSPTQPAERRSPDGRVRFLFDRYTESLVRESGAVADAAGHPALVLRLESGMMGQSLPVVLFGHEPAARTFDLFGLAAVNWVDALAADAASGPPPLLALAPSPTPAEAAVDRPRLELAPGADWSAGIPFRLTSSRSAPRTGLLRPGEPLATGWADWIVTLVEALPRAVPAERWREGGDGPVLPGTDVVAGLHGWMELPDGRRTEARWIPAGREANFRLEGIESTVVFGYRVERLPFTLALEKFEVPRDEGTDRPAAFISSLAFRDPWTGEVTRDWCGMNQPAIYPADWWGHLTGMAWKVSQASWNPDNLNESTVQILRDPGWSLKWIGSLAITAGLVTIFYLRPYRQRRPEDEITPPTRTSNA